MTPDAAMKTDYALYLKKLQQELAGLDGRRRALEAAIEAMKVLVGLDTEQTSLFPLEHAHEAPSDNGHKPKSAIPPGFFAGKTPTQAYRDFIRIWPGEYSPPQIADAFMAGGLKDKSRTALIQAIHSVLKRERKREAKVGRSVPV